jgi:hypothetical protein
MCTLSSLSSSVQTKPRRRSIHDVDDRGAGPEPHTCSTRNKQWSVSTIAGGDGQREVGFAATRRSPTTDDLHLRQTVERDGGLNLSTPREGLEVEEGATLPCLRLLHQRAPPSSCSTGPLLQVPPLTGAALLAAARAATMRPASASVH